MFRYETHCHMIYTSACCHLDAKTIGRLYKSNDYDEIETVNAGRSPLCDRLGDVLA